MGFGLLHGLAGVVWRTLRKRSSLSLIFILASSLWILGTVKDPMEELRASVQKEELRANGQEEEEVTPEAVHEALTLLEEIVSKVEAPCRKMALLGGVIKCSCKENKCAMDGAKYVCLDSDVMPPPSSCLALNFGIGFDLSFDAALANYGCRVFAFDPTNFNITNCVYRANISHSIPTMRSRGHLRSANARRVIHALDIGLAKKDHTLVLNITMDGLNFRDSVASYLTYRSILRLLDNPRVDLLKIDIEGSEWDILSEILDAPDAAKLLQNVRQILMEVHFDFLKPPVSAEEVLKVTWRVIAILQRLRDLGFQLAAYDLNDTAQTYVMYESMRLPVYREITLIRRGSMRL